MCCAICVALGECVCVCCAICVALGECVCVCVLCYLCRSALSPCYKERSSMSSRPIGSIYLYFTLELSDANIRYYGRGRLPGSPEVVYGRSPEVVYPGLQPLNPRGNISLGRSENASAGGCFGCVAGGFAAGTAPLVTVMTTTVTPGNAAGYRSPVTPWEITGLYLSIKTGA